MDEHKLADLFREAVRDAPPASFDESDVVAESNRLRARRRSGIMVGSALAVVILGGGAVVGVALLGGSEQMTANTASAPGHAEPNDGKLVPRQLPDARPETTSERPGRPYNSFPTEPSKQGGAPSGRAGSSAGNTPRGCEQADRELVAALADELPAAPVNREQAEPVGFDCPPGSRGGALRVRDGERSGRVAVLLVPKGVEPGIVAPGSEVPGAAAYSAEAKRSGGMVFVVSVPDNSSTPAPFNADAMGQVAERIGARF